jgi:hypothetical protein
VIHWAMYDYEEAAAADRAHALGDGRNHG